MGRKQKEKTTAQAPDRLPEYQPGQGIGASVFANLACEFSADQMLPNRAAGRRTALASEAWAATMALCEMTNKRVIDKSITAAQAWAAISGDRGNVAACRGLANWCKAIDVQIEAKAAK